MECSNSNLASRQLSIHDKHCRSALWFPVHSFKTHPPWPTLLVPLLGFGSNLGGAPAPRGPPGKWVVVGGCRGPCHLVYPCKRSTYTLEGRPMRPMTRGHSSCASPGSRRLQRGHPSYAQLCSCLQQGAIHLMPTLVTSLRVLGNAFCHDCWDIYRFVVTILVGF